MNQANFTKKRNLWLEEVSNNCHEYALKSDTDFYVFQTPCDKYNPDLLIIGINPGGGANYSDKLKEKGYKKRASSDLGYNVNTLTTKPEWEKGKNGKKDEKGSDVMRDRFSRVFSEENQLKAILENTVMMNMFYFNTPAEKGLDQVSFEAKEYCLNKTVEFIEILNPKNIIFLTSNESNLKKCKISHIKTLENNVKSGELNMRQVYAIPHYGYFGAYSSEKAATMGRSLHSFLNKN